MPDGTLYVGRDDFFSGGDPAAAVSIHRVSPDGSLVEEYGPPIDDPDAIAFDVDGSVSSMPGSVIVGGIVIPGGGRVTAILPDETIETVQNWNTFLNPTDMKFDTTGRLIVTTWLLQQVLVLENDTVSVLVTHRIAFLAIDAADNIYTVTIDGALRKHNAQGTSDPSWPGVI